MKTINQKIAEFIVQQDAKLNEKIGWDENFIASELNKLLTFRSVEIGWRQSCGSTDVTQIKYSAWSKLISKLEKEGISITQERVKHNNSYATNKGGFWQSIIFTLKEAT